LLSGEQKQINSRAPQNYRAHNLESIKVAAAVRRSERSSGEDAPLALEIWKG